MRTDDYSNTPRRDTTVETERVSRPVTYEEPRQTNFGLWPLLGLLAAALLLGWLWYANRPVANEPTTTAINREMPASPVASPWATASPYTNSGQ